MESPKYQSTLSKQGLTYNIIYHLLNMKEGESPYSVVENILSNFEFTSDLSN